MLESTKLFCRTLDRFFRVFNCLFEDYILRMGLGHVSTISDKDQVHFSKFGQNFSEIYLLKLENVKYKISSLQESKGNSHRTSKSYS